MDYSVLTPWKAGEKLLDFSEEIKERKERRKKHTNKKSVKEGKLDMFNVSCQCLINNGLFRFGHVERGGKTLLGFSEERKERKKNCLTSPANTSNICQL